MPNPWVILGLVAAWLASLGAVGVWQHKAGVTSDHDQWETREAKINADAATQIAAANDRVTAQEHASAIQINAVDTSYQTKLKDKDNALNVALNAVRTGGLFVHAACPSVAGNSGSKVTASASVDNGGTVARLSDQDANFLLSEASRADAIVIQLTACQAIVKADRQ